MDWNSLKSQAQSLSQKAVPVFTKIRGFWSDVRDFVESQMQSTPLFLKKMEEYNQVQSTKKVILIATTKKSEAYHSLMARYLLYAKDAFAYNAKIRFIDIHDTPDITSSLRIDTDPTMIILYQGFEYQRYVGFEAIQNWWKNPAFYDDEKPASLPSESPVDDPLQATDVSSSPSIPVAPEKTEEKTSIKKTPVKKKPSIPKKPESVSEKSPSAEKKIPSKKSPTKKTTSVASQSRKKTTPTS